MNEAATKKQVSKIPLQLRIASALGVLSGGVGSLIGGLFIPDFYGLATGFLIGFTIGFLGGYHIGGMIKTAGTAVVAERLAAGVDIGAIVIGFLFVLTGLISLILNGWNVLVFLAILFFLTCSVYLCYRRYQT